jgi:branched-chain amino acid aminotransferase
LAQINFPKVPWIWVDGELVEFDHAHFHLLSHGLHYGSGVFEGIRTYDTARGTAVFRLREHLDRMVRSCRLIRLDLPYTVEQLAAGVLELLRANEMKAAYVRPLAFRGFGNLRVFAPESPTVVALAVWPTRGGNIQLGESGGIDACVSSWRRIPQNALPPTAKATANYLNSQLIKTEAEQNGYSEGIGLDEFGNVAEASAENVFLVRDGVLLTPPGSGTLLPGITRDCVITLAADLGIEVREEIIPRGFLYTCDELFLTGTSVEIVAVQSIDRIPLRSAAPGEITRRLSRELHALARGEAADRHGWLTMVGS